MRYLIHVFTCNWMNGQQRWRLHSTSVAAQSNSSCIAADELAGERAVNRRSIKLRSLVVLILGAVLLIPHVEAQASNEALLSTENAYNPIPSPVGKYLAYVRTGWGRPPGSGGFGRSNLVSEVEVIDSGGKRVANSAVADALLSGWKPNGTDLVCYRDGEYSLVSMDGKHSSKGRLPGPTNVLGTEPVVYLPRSGMMIWSRQSGFHTVLETPNGVFTQHDGWQGALIAPSPDGKVRGHRRRLAAEPSLDVRSDVRHRSEEVDGFGRG
jgi:hypothetical protein